MHNEYLNARDLPQDPAVGRELGGIDYYPGARPSANAVVQRPENRRIPGQTTPHEGPRGGSQDERQMLSEPDLGAEGSRSLCICRGGIDRSFFDDARPHLT